MQPEDLFCHGTLKGEIHGMLYQRIKRGSLGHLFIDSTRVSCPKADLSVEPDIVFVSHDAVDNGRVRLAPGATHEPKKGSRLFFSPSPEEESGPAVPTATSLGDTVD